MATFRSFLRAHPSEVIIFRYKDETRASGDFCGLHKRVVQEYDRLGYVWKTGSNYNADLGRSFPFLKQIRGKIVILRNSKAKDHNACDYGYWFDVKELDNYGGGGKNPITGRENTKDMVDTVFGRRSIDVEPNMLYNETIIHISNQSLTSKTTFNVEEDMGNNQSQIAEAKITEDFVPVNKMLDID